MLPERVVRFRRDDRAILYCNVAKAAEYGLTPEQLVGRTLDDVLPVSEREQLRSELARLSWDAPVRRLVTRADDRWIEWVDQLVAGADGDEVLSVGRDVTGRHLVEVRLRESEQRFRLAMDAAPIGMALVGLDARILRVNRALCEFVGRTEEELVGRTTLDITHPDDVEADLEYGRRLLNGEDAQVSLKKRYLHTDGSVVWGLLKASMVRDDGGAPLYMVGQVVDITDQVERETALEQAAAIEREAADRLRDLDDMKNTFLSAVSHELRTPLTVVQGFAELLRSRHEELTADRTRQVLDRLASNATRLSELLTDLLDLDRMVRGGAIQPNLVETDLAVLVGQVVEAMDLQGRTVTTELAAARIGVDPPKVERIVQNLLANVVRHTSVGTPLWVVVTAVDGGARITVEDAGPGVPDEAKHTIFEPFEMGRSDAAKVGGTGVGLALVSRFAALHGGRAWVEDRPGGGSSFHVWLPEAAPGVAPTGTGPVGPPRGDLGP